MVDDALRDGHGLIGMIQPDAAHGAQSNRAFTRSDVPDASLARRERRWRYLIELTGVARFRIEEELKVATPYRQCRVTRAFR